MEASPATEGPSMAADRSRSPIQRSMLLEIGEISRFPRRRSSPATRGLSAGGAVGGTRRRGPLRIGRRRIGRRRIGRRRRAVSRAGLARGRVLPVVCRQARQARGNLEVGALASLGGLDVGAPDRPGGGAAEAGGGARER